MNGSESKTPMFVRKTEPAYMSIRKTGQVTGLGESFIRNGVKKGTVPGFYVAGEGSKFMVNVPLLMSALEPVKHGLKLYVDAYRRQHGKWDWRNAKVFCLTNFDTTHEQDMERVGVIQECECQPYVMIYNKPSALAITRRLQRWTNNTALYAKYRDFIEYQRDNYKAVIESWQKDKKETVSQWLDRLLA